MQIHRLDNVEINLENGHKYALCDIKKGEHVHTHNLKTGLSGKLEYSYQPSFYELPKVFETKTFQGYLRENGDVGIRNEIWIINTVGCVNKIAETLAQKTGAISFSHPYGCSQLGGDLLITQQILAGMVNHPNAAGVLVLGLECENNHIDAFKQILGKYDPKRVKFLNCQDVEDEIAEGISLIQELQSYADTFQRTDIPISKLRIGLKCGGSDGFSGITANPLIGRLSDQVIAMGRKDNKMWTFSFEWFGK